MDVAEMNSTHNMIDHYRQDAASKEKDRAQKVIDLICGVDVELDKNLQEALKEYGFMLVDSDPGQRLTTMKYERGNCYFVLYESFLTNRASGELIKQGE